MIFIGKFSKGHNSVKNVDGVTVLPLCQNIANKMPVRTDFIRLLLRKKSNQGLNCYLRYLFSNFRPADLSITMFCVSF